MSSAASAALSADRRSTSNHASNGIALTDVPPPIRPTLNVVRGDVGTVRSDTAATARPERVDRVGGAEGAVAVPARPA